MDKETILPSHFAGHLADGLQERLRFHIAHGTADFGDHHVGFAVVHIIDAPLDLIGDMGDDLHGAAQKFPGPLPVEDTPIDFTGGHRAVYRQIFIDKPFIVTQIQVRLRAVVGDEDFAVLIGAHGARVHIEIGVQLLNGHPQAPCLQQPSQRGGGNALAQSRYHAAGDKNTLDSHSLSSVSKLKNNRQRIRVSAAAVKHIFPVPINFVGLSQSVPFGMSFFGGFSAI